MTTMQAPPTPEHSDTSAAPSASNMLSRSSKKRSLSNFLEDTQNILAGREIAPYPYSETMPLNVIVPRGTHRVLYPKLTASKEPAPRQNGHCTHDGEQAASKAMQEDQAAEAQAQVRRLRMEHEALTRCLIKTMTRDTLEHLLANAAFQFPSIMHSIIASNNPNSANAQPSHQAEQNTIASGRHTTTVSKASTDLSSPQPAQLSTLSTFGQPASLAPNHIAQPSNTLQTDEREIVFDPNLHGSTSNGWTVQDDRLLKASRDQGMSWPQIQAKYFPSRTHSQCRLRLARVFGVNSKLEDRSPYTMVPWTPEEDARLLAARKSGMLWHQLQQTHFPNRTHFACSHRHRKLLRDKKRDDGARAVISSDEHADLDLDETEDDETLTTNTSVNNRPMPWSTTEDEQLLNGRQSGMQFFAIQQKYFPHRSQQSVDSRYWRLKRMQAAGSSRDLWSVQWHGKERQKRGREKDDMALDDLLTVSDANGMETGDKEEAAIKDGNDDMAMDGLVSPSEDEDELEPARKRRRAVPGSVPKPHNCPKNLPATAAQPSDTPVPIIEREQPRIPLPPGPQDTKERPPVVNIEDSEKQDEQDEELEEDEGVDMTDEDEELPDPESTITVQVPPDYDP